MNTHPKDIRIRLFLIGSNAARVSGRARAKPGKRQQRGRSVICLDRAAPFETAPQVLAALSAPNLPLAQGTTQTVATVDVKALTTGYRSSKIVGSDVVNENHDTIGKIDDLLVSREQHRL